MVDHEEFRRWRAEANEAFGLARDARASGRHNWACFLSEQAAQLALKALLHGLGAGPWGHDLVKLGQALSEAVEQPLGAALEETVVRLSRHYIATRYPDTHPAGSPSERYTAGDADAALGDAGQVLAAVDDLWQQLQA